VKTVLVLSASVKTVCVDEQPKQRQTPRPPKNGQKTKKQTNMKTLKSIIIVLTAITAAASLQAGEVSGYFRSNGTYVAPYYRSDPGSLGRSHSSGYVYRNPYAAYPSVYVHGYYRSNGTYVEPYVRTAPNSTETDNLSYRGFGTICVPPSAAAWSFDPDLSLPRTMPYYGSSRLELGVLPYSGDYLPHATPSPYAPSLFQIPE
jgi:hypothetical protein